MGEYANYGGSSVKIGTCEDMYYLRHDQRHAVSATRGNVDPVADVAALRFRFPWPDEDHITPGSGEFHDKGFHRGVTVYGYTMPAGVDHSLVQFVAQAGYNVCLPCPESEKYTDNAHGGRTLNAEIRVHRNGFSGSVQLVAQKWVEGVGLVPILRCGGCGSMWREQEPARIEEIAMCFRAEADRQTTERNPDGGKFWHTIADRILAGISAEVRA